MHFASNTYLHQNVEFSTYEGLYTVYGLLVMAKLAGPLMGIKNTDKGTKPESGKISNCC